MKKKALLPLALAIGLAHVTCLHAQEELDEITITVVPQKTPLPKSVTNRIELPEAIAVPGHRQARGEARPGPDRTDRVRERRAGFSRGAAEQTLEKRPKLEKPSKPEGPPGLSP